MEQILINLVAGALGRQRNSISEQLETSLRVSPAVAYLVRS
jgi:hypothetical protein